MNYLSNPSKAFTSIGSFWHTLTTEDAQKQARYLSYLARDNNILGRVKSELHRLEGKEFQEGTSEHFIFSEKDVVFIGRGFYETLKNNNLTEDTPIRVVNKWWLEWNQLPVEAEEVNIDLGTLNKQFKLFKFPPAYAQAELKVNKNLYLSNRWVLCCDSRTIPSSIRTIEGLKVLNIDYEWDAGVIHFFKNPTRLFKEGSVLINTTYKRMPSYMNFPLGVDSIIGDTSEISTYYRYNQTPEQFKKAVSQVAGLKTVKVEGFLTSKYVKDENYTYHFDNGETITITYPHTPLRVGVVYPVGFIIGGNIRVSSKETYDDTWYRQRILWTDTPLSLDKLTPFKGLEVRDEDVNPTQVGTEVSAGNFHIRFDIKSSNDYVVEEQNFWNRVHSYEESSGNYLSKYLGLTAAGDGNPTAETINKLDTVFKLLDNHLMLVEIGDLPAESRDRIVNFLDREKPIASVPLIREKTPENIVTEYLIGNSIDSTFNVAHKYSSMNVMMDVYNINTGVKTWADITVVDADTVQLNTASIPGASDYLVVVVPAYLVATADFELTTTGTAGHTFGSKDVHYRLLDNEGAIVSLTAYEVLRPDNDNVTVTLNSLQPTGESEYKLLGLPSHFTNLLDESIRYGELGTSFIVSHNLKTRNIIITLVDTDTGKDAYATITVMNQNQVRVDFSESVVSGKYKLLISYYG